MTRSTLQKIEQPPATLRDIVQERMRDAIIAGHFKPGERLVERPLCAQLGVSRTVIRETIRYLEAEGLVETLPHKGPIVARLSQDDARQIYAVRRMLETSAAGACARAITPSIAKDVQAAFKTLETAVAKTDPAAVVGAADAFYGVIFNGAGQQIAWDIVQRLNGRIGSLRMMTLTSAPETAHMGAICEAVIAGNPQAAREAAKRHIDTTAMIADRLVQEMQEAAQEEAPDSHVDGI